MGYDAGFDLVPQLSQSPEDKTLWTTFISKIQDRYSSDPDVEFKQNYIEWKKGEHPLLPYSGHKFMRFSSKISGRCEEVEEDLIEVARIARGVFGKRVHWWSELCDDFGVYGWKEVNESLKAYDEVEEPEEQEDTPKLFTIQTIPNKGRALIATQDIPPGTRIIAEKPLFTMKSTVPSINLLETPISQILNSLPEHQKSQYHSLHNNYKGKHPTVCGIFKTNALPCGCDSPVGGVYLTISFINHSCLPNTHHSWNDLTKRETIHSTRLIKSGEELTIAYATEDPSKLRQKKLKENFGFTCTCQLCSLSPRKIKFSDRRRGEIQALDNSIAYGGKILTDPTGCLKDCRRLVKLLEEEYQGCSQALEARAYYDAFQICAGQGDQARARVMAERGYKLRVCCEGEDSESTMQLKALIWDPSSHRAYGMSSMDWRSGRDEVPEGLEGDAFEKWLWKL
ncbi:hypothetical protein TWF281_000814 [Arthrobotrys megalospora]